MPTTLVRQLSANNSFTEQLVLASELVHRAWNIKFFSPYFQAVTARATNPNRNLQKQNAH